MLKTLTLTNFPKFSFTASVVRIEAATKFGNVYNMDNTFFEFQEIFMNSFVFTTTDENKVDLWYNLSAA